MEAVRKTDFLSSIHKRAHIPGGACRFDLPALHNWLQQDGAVRNRHLQEWLEPFAPMREAVTLILQLIRDSATLQPEIAVRGFFQRGLDNAVSTQLIRVLLPSGNGVFPEISASRHRFAIHFLEQPVPSLRANQSTNDISFDLACCVI